MSTERSNDVDLLDLCSEGKAAKSNIMRNACLNARSSKASPLLFKAVLRAVGIAYEEFTSNTLTLTLTRPARRPARSKTARARSKLVEA